MNEYEREMLELYKKSLGEKTNFTGIVCPGTYKKPCRLCDLCKEVLFNKGIPKEAPLRKRASSLNAKQHYFSNIIFLADPSTVVCFEYGDKIFKQLLAMQMNADQGFKDFWHPITGRWLIIERIQGATKEQVDYYVKPKDPTKLADMSVLSKMYNLDQITDLTRDQKVKPIYQSKLEKTSIIRVLPSWLGPDYGMKFFAKVDYHYNISEEDFRATQAGEINPVRIGGEDAPKSAPVQWNPTPAPKVEIAPAVDWGNSWGTSTATVQAAPAPKEEAMPMEEDDDLPACYGEYDATDADCSSKACVDWSEGCKQYREEKLAKRRAAKRLSK